jgi:hypothetical protein
MDLNVKGERRITIKTKAFSTLALITSLVHVGYWYFQMAFSSIPLIKM